MHIERFSLNLKNSTLSAGGWKGNVRRGNGRQQIIIREKGDIVEVTESRWRGGGEE